MHNWNLTNAFAIIHTMPNSYPFTSWPSLAPFAKTLPTPNGNLFYYDTGVSDKQAVILLHGLGDEADTWRHVFPALTGAGYRVIAPDLPGFGRSVWKGGINVRGHCKAVIQLIKGINTAGQSPAPAAIEPGFAGGFPQQSANQRFGGVLNPSVPHSLDHARASAVAASLHSLINATGAASAERPAVVAGSSLGAGIAEMVADRRPGFVQKLILIDSCLPFAGISGKWLYLLGLPFLGRRWYRGFRARPEAAWLSLYPYYSDLDAMSAEDKAFLRQRVIDRVLSPNQERGYFATLRSMNAFFLFCKRSISRKIKAFPGSIALIWGEKDNIFPAEKAAPFRLLRPDAHFSIIAGAGHLPHQEKPGETAAEMLRFLQEK